LTKNKLYGEMRSMKQNNQKIGVCDLIVEITNSLKIGDLIGYSIYNGCYSVETITSIVWGD
jgi:hypothetical protein